MSIMHKSIYNWFKQVFLNYVMIVHHELLNPENMRTTAKGCERKVFLNFFYKRYMRKLIAPILSIRVKYDSNDNRVYIAKNVMFYVH